jgi:hypothetical protein
LALAVAVLGLTGALAPTDPIGYARIRCRLGEFYDWQTRPRVNLLDRLREWLADVRARLGP